jgi:putative endonuclease
MQTARQILGQKAENLAAAHLESHGVIVLARNYRRRLGELDLVGREGNILIIVEVRTRSSAQFGGAAASVDRRKQLRIVRAAHQLLQEFPQLARLPVRFDVVVVHDADTKDPPILWLKHAF